MQHHHLVTHESFEADADPVAAPLEGEGPALRLERDTFDLAGQLQGRLHVHERQEFFHNLNRTQPSLHRVRLAATVDRVGIEQVQDIALFDRLIHDRDRAVEGRLVSTILSAPSRRLSALTT